MTKTEMDQIKNYEELLLKPDLHISFLKEAPLILIKSENQLLDADIKWKQLFDDANAERIKIIADADAEKNNLLAYAEKQWLETDEERKKLQTQVEKQRLEADTD